MTDYTLGDTFDIKFTTRAFATGIPTTPAGSPAVAAYPGNSTTEITAGITLTTAFDSRAGLNNIRIVATSGNGYAAGTTYYLVITAGTVDSVSVVGEVVGEFTLGRSAANTRATDIQSRIPAALTSNGNIKASLLEILSTALTETSGQIAAAFKQFFNVASPTGTMKAVTAVGTVTGNVDGSVASVTGNVGGNVAGSVGSLGATAKSDVNAEVVDALATDTYAEPGQGAPAATTSLAAKINYLYKAFRNRKTQTSTTWQLYADDASTVDQKSTVSDNGTTAERGEIASGP
jgi:hypothetical protein